VYTVRVHCTDSDRCYLLPPLRWSDAVEVARQWTRRPLELQAGAVAAVAADDCYRVEIHHYR
jgi:hypothetical protein